MKKLDFVAIFDNCVTDDLIIRFIRAESMEEAYRMAVEISKCPGLSVGKFDLYINTMHIDDSNLNDEYCIQDFGNDEEEIYEIAEKKENFKKRANL